MKYLSLPPDFNCPVEKLAAVTPVIVRGVAHGISLSIDYPRRSIPTNVQWNLAAILIEEFIPSDLAFQVVHVCLGEPLSPSELLLKLIRLNLVFEQFASAGPQVARLLELLEVL